MFQRHRMQQEVSGQGSLYGSHDPGFPPAAREHAHTDGCTATAECC